MPQEKSASSDNGRSSPTPDGGRKRKAPIPWPLIPSGPEHGPDEEHRSLFFHLAKLPLGGQDTILVLRKLPNRCHFQLVEIVGAKLPKGEVINVQPAACKKLGERWAAQRKKHPKDPKVHRDHTLHSLSATCTDDGGHFS